MGLPMLTLSGETFVSRMAGSRLWHQGFEELLTHTHESYVSKAVWLAKNKNELKDIKTRLGSCQENEPNIKRAAFTLAMEKVLTNLVSFPGKYSTTGAVKAPRKNIVTIEKEKKKLINKQNLEEKVKIYQIAYSEETYNLILPPFKVLDNRENLRPDWQEYWPIRNFLLQEKLDQDSYYGFFSPRFTEKTGLSGQQLVEFIKNSNNNEDVYIFSPQPDMGAFFLNVFEQNEVFDAGFLRISQEFFDYIGFEIDLKKIVMDSRNIVFSNYFVAKPKFWKIWIDINESLFNICEKNNPKNLSEAMLQNTNYRDGLARKIFLSERIASTILIMNPDFKIKSFNTFKCAWSASNLGELKNEAVLSDALKIASTIQDFEEFIHEFYKIRSKIINEK
jgi:hypothetical protein